MPTYILVFSDRVLMIPTHVAMASSADAVPRNRAHATNMHIERNRSRIAVVVAPDQKPFDGRVYHFNPVEIENVDTSTSRRKSNIVVDTLIGRAPNVLIFSLVHSRVRVYQRLAALCAELLKC